MYKTAIIALMTLALVAPAQAQVREITLLPASQNMSACAAGDSTWAKKWLVTASGDVATVAGGTPVRLKRVDDGTYQDVLHLGNSGTFMITFTDRGQSGVSLRVDNKALGCVWQGSAR